MLRTRFFALSGTILTFSSILLGSHFWGYQRFVLILQAGIIALGLGLFFRLTNNERDRLLLAQLYDLEGEPYKVRLARR